MMSDLIKNTDYKNWLQNLKSKIQNSQIKAALAVNTQLILRYWDLGKQIVEKQETSRWGSGFIDQLAKDLKASFPDVKGFSKRNLELIRQFYSFYTNTRDKAINNADILITKQAVSQLANIPWGHNILILQKIKNLKEAFFYVQQTIENNWSRSILEMQIESNLYSRQGKAINNFKHTLPKPQSDLANQLLKDPYNFDFLTLSQDVQELDLEKKTGAKYYSISSGIGQRFCIYG